MSTLRYVSGFLAGAALAALGYWATGAVTVVSADRVYIWCGR